MESRPQKYKERAKEYYHELKRDPERYRLYLQRKAANTHAWYQRTKRNFLKYEALLKRQNEKLRAYRASGSKKYLARLKRHRERLALNPFRQREQRKRWYERIKNDPVKYQQYLERCKKWYHEIKSDPIRYQEFLAGRKVYQRYYRILKKNQI